MQEPADPKYHRVPVIAIMVNQQLEQGRSCAKQKNSLFVWEVSLVLVSRLQLKSTVNNLGGEGEKAPPPAIMTGVN